MNNEIEQRLHELQVEYEEVDSEIEHLRGSVQEEEVSSDPEESTELSKTLESDLNSKEKIRGNLEQLQDDAYYGGATSRVDPPKATGLVVAQLQELVKKDLQTIASLKDEIPSEDSRYDLVRSLEEKLDDLENRVDDFQNDLKDTLPEVNDRAFPQDSSNFYPENMDLPEFDQGE